MALDDPLLLGVHLSNLDLAPYTVPGSSVLSGAERDYLAQFAWWEETDRGSGAIQSRRHQAVGYGLNDSPAGLAAWVLEKWRAWADSGGDLDATLTRDFLLTVVTLYWATQTITSSRRDYLDNGRAGRWGRPISSWPLPRSQSSTSSSMTVDRCASGRSACTTSSVGRPCPAVGTSPHSRYPSCRPGTSQPSSLSSGSVNKSERWG